VPGNAGVYLPRDGYLEFLREITTANNSLLIFDEVMTGFRVSLGGAQERFGVTPDLSCFGKIIGGGLPVGAFGGRAEVMDVLAPDGPVYQAGTLSGNPLAMAAGLAALEELKTGAVHEQLETIGARLESGLNAAAERAGIPVITQRAGSMSCLFFAEQPVHNLAEAMKADRERFKQYFHGMLAEGVYLAPSAFEAAFLSAAHTEADIDSTIAAAEKVMATL
jgi:glutamate-1-semialdehyde 2,1-aminomutase